MSVISGALAGRPRRFGRGPAPLTARFGCLLHIFFLSGNCRPDCYGPGRTAAAQRGHSAILSYNRWDYVRMKYSRSSISY